MLLLLMLGVKGGHTRSMMQLLLLYRCGALEPDLAGGHDGGGGESRPGGSDAHGGEGDRRARVGHVHVSSDRAAPGRGKAEGGRGGREAAGEAAALDRGGGGRGLRSAPLLLSVPHRRGMGRGGNRRRDVLFLDSPDAQHPGHGPDSLLRLRLLRRVRRVRAHLQHGQQHDLAPGERPEAWSALASGWRPEKGHLSERGPVRQRGRRQ